MKVLKFNLSGDTAFFKKPDVNTYYYFTYGNVHKVALLGIFGAILGLGGYSQQTIEEYPEFYEKLKDLRVSIVPLNPSGYISKKIQVFNNSVGYASKEEGGNLIVKEQWLENPKWDIYIMINNDELSKEIEDRFMNYSFKYIPYLGKNDHYANIQNVKIIDNLQQVQFIDEDKIDSLFKSSEFKVSVNQEDDLFEEEEELWRYKERLPVALDRHNNQYITEGFIFTNMKLQRNSDTQVYLVDNKNIVFF